MHNLLPAPKIRLNACVLTDMPVPELQFFFYVNILLQNQKIRIYSCDNQQKAAWVLQLC